VGRAVGHSCGSLVLLRHGQSAANAAGLFTGVLDSPLTDIGVEEARSAGVLLRDAGVTTKVAFSSELTRARQTADIIAAFSDVGAIRRDWRLNERNYGALTGRAKDDVLQEFGATQFLIWRRAVNVAPPPMSDEMFREFATRKPFRSLPASSLTRTESLRNVIYRVNRFYHNQVTPFLKRGHSVLVVAHGNSLRALCAVLDELDDDAIEQLNIPTAQPLCYQFDHTLTPVTAGGLYLDESNALAAADAIAHEGGT
jgi:2,3-bisphosphoglycerate-dependent phosphoglycerate mutase